MLAGFMEREYVINAGIELSLGKGFKICFLLKLQALLKDYYSP